MPRITAPTTTKEQVLDTVSDLVSNFVYYDRKEDENFPRGRLQEMIAAGDITVDEIVAVFALELAKAVR